MQKFQYVRHTVPEILIDFLCRRFPYQAREVWVDHIEKGAVKIDDRQVSPEYLLETKNVISYERPREDEPGVDDSYSILFEDESIVVVEKSGNIPISESGKYYKNTLLYILKEKEGYTSLHAVHRLDRETSGVIVIARNSEIAELFRKQFTAAKPRKKYQAVLIGEMSETEIMVDQPIKKIGSQGLVRIRQIIDPEGKPSRTLIKPVRTGNGLTLAEVETRFAVMQSLRDIRF
jgi:23S rRNA-/tRNA-specific pseudouridylate synthase